MLVFGRARVSAAEYRNENHRLIASRPAHVEASACVTCRRRRLRHRTSGLHPLARACLVRTTAPHPTQQQQFFRRGPDSGRASDMAGGGMVLEAHAGVVAAATRVLRGHRVPVAPVHGDLRGGRLLLRRRGRREVAAAWARQRAGVRGQLQRPGLGIF